MESECSPWGIDGAALGELALAEGVSRLGVTSRPWWRFCELPLVALGQLRWSRGEREELSVDVLGASAGLGVHLSASTLPVALELRGELVGERASLRARDVEGRVEAAGVWRLGGRAGVDVLMRWGGGWAVFVGGELSVLRPRLVVDVAEEPRMREGWWGVGGLAGVRWQASP